jgi:hypothetical protein
MPAAIEAEHLEFGTAGFIADAGGDRQSRPGRNRDAIRPRTGREDGARCETEGIEASQACRATAGHQNRAGGRDHAVTSIVLCHQEKGTDALRFVFVGEDSEQDAVH